MGIPQKLMDKYDYLNEAILIGWRGSIAHGMYVPQADPTSIDDKDVMAVVIPSMEHYFGLETWGSRGTKEFFEDEWDVVSYEVLKFISLLEKSNPNVLSLLWMEPNDYIKITPRGQLLLDAKELFVTKQAYHSFCGYAYSQLKRMTRFKFEGYMGDKRKRLVEKFGYDTKNAAHLIRLLRMGIEYLNEGVLYVKRKDRAQLLEIKKGEWTLEQVKAESEHLFKRIENVYDSCSLPSKPDRKAVNELCRNILESN